MPPPIPAPERVDAAVDAAQDAAEDRLHEGELQLVGIHDLHPEFIGILDCQARRVPLVVGTVVAVLEVVIGNREMIVRTPVGDVDAEVIECRLRRAEAIDRQIGRRQN